ncbi:methylglyoxal reductase (NADPH-dependent) gre2 [Scheffersomyces spartinae]|uniref:Methylglyoxal reductase (NADPH-dependent) gre2 n=1 Tax=Scheffersomyces spartinae TaxID=45513 RepID=A0A9P7V6R1_9ASCO|nr:methylglyoxal reductase (NADPH-dependent) gre2 [Scheffersomyces spartinae]KAG7192395.1 methylglyoxal reductase (NADPH-dependent) gre2 [Scheffersomyces spartinae]
MTSIFVTGASGFIAQHIIKLLVSKGYKVVGTVRSSSKGADLVSNLGSNFTYEIVPDISSPNAFDEALKTHPEVTVVLHTASPFFFDTTDPEKDLIIPAIRGTENIMNAIVEYAPQVTRMVVTLSDAAIYSLVDECNPELLFNEQSWNNITYEEAVKDPVAAYYGAKLFAEKHVWKFLKEYPGNKLNFAVTSVNPVYVFGPQAFDLEVKPTLNTSNQVIKTLIELGPNDAFELNMGGAVDVRDVALAHIAGFEREDTIGRRLFMTSGQFLSQMMLDIINENIPSLQGKIPRGTPGSGPQDIRSLAKTDNSATRNLLGWEFTPFKKTVIDTVNQILHVKPVPKI